MQEGIVVGPVKLLGHTCTSTIRVDHACASLANIDRIEEAPVLVAEDIELTLGELTKSNLAFGMITYELLAFSWVSWRRRREVHQENVYGSEASVCPVEGVLVA